VHHTPDPDRAIGEVAARVAPGGYLVLGFYETLGRLAHRARRGLSRVTGRPVRLLDPVLRRSDLDEEKKRIWIEDQYRHPLEHILPLTGVFARLRELDFAWVRSIPPSVGGAGLFDPTPVPDARRMRRLRTGFMLRGLRDPDAGLICLIARRHRSSERCSATTSASSPLRR
jgi:hypothetical protein